jgi:hypothetical protein
MDMLSPPSRSPLAAEPQSANRYPVPPTAPLHAPHVVHPGLVPPGRLLPESKTLLRALARGRTCKSLGREPPAGCDEQAADRVARPARRVVRRPNVGSKGLGVLGGHKSSDIDIQRLHDDSFLDLNSLDIKILLGANS